MPLGRTLREARERRQMTMSQLAAATRMKVQVVEAIEAENFRKFPAPVYGRGFIKLYAEAVGLDPKPLIDEYMARLNQEQSAPPPSMAVGRPPTRPPARPTAPASQKPQPSPLPGTAVTAPSASRSVETWLEADPAPPPVASPSACEVHPPAPGPAAATEPPAPVKAAEPEPAATPQPPSPSLPAAPEPGASIGAPTSDDDLFAFASKTAPAQPEPVPHSADVDQPGPHAVPGPAEPAPLPAESDALFAPPPISRPPRTGFSPRPAPAPAGRRAPREESDEPPRLSGEREALLRRTIGVGAAVLVLLILLIVLISNCSAPATKEVQRGPIKERLHLVVEPPPHYVR